MTEVASGGSGALEFDVLNAVEPPAGASSVVGVMHYQSSWSERRATAVRQMAAKPERRIEVQDNLNLLLMRPDSL